MLIFAERLERELLGGDHACDDVIRTFTAELRRIARQGGDWDEAMCWLRATIVQEEDPQDCACLEGLESCLNLLLSE